MDSNKINNQVQEIIITYEDVSVEIENLKVFAGSETIFGTNENENYSMFSLSDEDKKELNSRQYQTAIENLRYGMEKFNLFDNEAIFIFSDKALQEKVMKISTPELKVTKEQIKFIENLNQFNSSEQ